MMTSKFLTIQEVSEALHVTPTHVQNLINAGKLKAYKFGDVRAVRVKQTDLDEFVKGAEVNQGLTERGTNFHTACLEFMIESKENDIFAAAEKLKDRDPSGYKDWKYWKDNRYKSRGVQGVEKLKFDSPSYDLPVVSRSGGVTAGDYEATVEQIMREEHCSEGEAIRRLMTTEQGKKLYESYKANLEKQIERRRVYGNV